MNVLMYTKKNCPLCEEAKKMLDELQEELAFTFQEIDIYEDDSLLEKYQLMIPVVEIDGEEVAFGRIQKEELKKQLI